MLCIFSISDLRFRLTPRWIQQSQIHSSFPVSALKGLAAIVGFLSVAICMQIHTQGFIFFYTMLFHNKNVTAWCSQQPRRASQGAARLLTSASVGSGNSSRVLPADPTWVILNTGLALANAFSCFLTRALAIFANGRRDIVFSHCRISVLASRVLLDLSTNLLVV